jgi:amino acid adenylation domain-containing protein/FkbM family methyltransferase
VSAKKSSLEEKRERARALLQRRAARAPASFAQERLWFLDQLAPGSAVYNIPCALRFRGRFEPALLRQAFQQIARRHAVLRTRFAVHDGQLHQVVADEVDLPFELLELDGAGDVEAEMQARVAREAQRPFDLAAAPLCRAVLLRLSSTDHALVFTIHHAVADGWSIGIFVRELSAIYEALGRGRPSPLAELPIQYADFAAWQRSSLASGALEAQLAYWKAQLEGASPILELPTDRPRPAEQSFRGALEPVRFSPDVSRALADFSRREGVTPFMTLLAGLDLVLHRHAGQSDVVVGVPVAGRTRPELEGIIGLFANTLALRGQVSPAESFRSLLVRVREATLAAYAHQDLPFDRLVEELAPARDMSRSPVFQVMFALQNMPVPPLDLPGLAVEPIDVPSATSRFDLSLILLESEAGLRGSVEYSTDLFEASTIRRMVRHLELLLAEAVRDPERPVSTLSLVDPAERQQVVVTWNDTAVELARPLPVHELFEEQAALRPQARALVFEQTEMTYGELKRSTDRLARRLQMLGVGADGCVGLCAHRSLEMVVAVLGILKAGGGYLPLDPDAPDERLAWMLREAAPRVVLTGPGLAARFAEHGVDAIELDLAAESAAPAEPFEPPVASTRPDNMAYVIYTSGSTGRPKGVVNTHGSLLNRVLWTQAAYPLSASDVVLHKTPYTFDVSVWEFVWPLSVGATLVVARPDGHRDVSYLAGEIERCGVTLLHFVPWMLEVFVEATAVGRCPSLRRVLCSGEALPYQLARRFADRFGAELVNLYGPTEAAIDVSAWTFPRGAEEPVVPIGRPVWNTQLYVLDPWLNPAPVGMTGELYIGGDQLARGYVGRPDLTAERFLPDPFRTGARLYRTGDLCRWRTDGTIEYVGRNDDQVKLHGNRIELGEVAHVLHGHPAVRDAAVVVRDGAAGDRRLVAYAVLAGPSAVDSSGESAEAAAVRAILEEHPGISEAFVHEHAAAGGPSRLVAYLVPDPEAAGPVARMLRLVSDGRVSADRVSELPNGLALVEQNAGETAFLYREIFAEDGYLRHGVRLRDGDTVFDVGANIGMFALYAARAAADVTVYAVEPIPPLCDLLRLNAHVHGIRGRVLEVGLAAESGSAEFTYYAHNSLLSGAHADAAEDAGVVRALLENETTDAADLMDGALAELAAFAQSETGRFICPVRTLSDVVREEAVGTIDLLKIDVEKAEADVLAGIEEDDWPKIRQIVVEVHDVAGRLARIAALLESHGFRCAVEQDRLLRGTRLFSLFAVRPEPADRAATQPSAAHARFAGSSQLLADVRAHSVERIAEARRPAAFVLVHALPRTEDGCVDRQALPAPPPSEPGVSGADLRAHVAARLPDYMVPSAVVLLEALPLTPHGKLDRRALPAPELGRRSGRAAGPLSPQERTVLAAWTKVLGVAEIGADEDFFELGGTSLGLARLAFRIRELTGVQIPVRSLYQAPTIARQAELLEQQLAGSPDGMQRITRRPAGDEVPISYGQERIWRWQAVAPHCTAYHIPAAVRILGPLDVAALERALFAIQRRHEVLRSFYREVDGRLVQTIAPDGSAALPVVDVSSLAEPARTRAALDRAGQEVQRRFDLSRDAPMRCLLLRVGAAEHVLVVVWHHIVADNRAVAVFFRELTTLLEASSADGDRVLPDLPFQYGDYAHWQRSHLAGEARDPLMAYWAPRIRGARPLEMETDKPLTAEQERPLASFPCAELGWSMPPATREALAGLSRSAGVTLSVVVLASLFAWLHRFSRHRDISVTSSYHGHDRPEIEQVFGYFARPLLLRVDLADDPAFEELIRRMKNVLYGAFAHAELPLFEVAGAPTELISRMHVVYQNAEESPLSGRFGPWFPLPTGRFRSRYMFLGIREGRSDLLFSVRYNADAFERATIAGMFGYYQALLGRIVDGAGARVSELERRALASTP